jgi:hypothetical protein
MTEMKKRCHRCDIDYPGSVLQNNKCPRCFGVDRCPYCRDVIITNYRPGLTPGLKCPSCLMLWNSEREYKDCRKKVNRLKQNGMEHRMSLVVVNDHKNPPITKRIEDLSDKELQSETNSITSVSDTHAGINLEVKARKLDGKTGYSAAVKRPGEKTKFGYFSGPSGLKNLIVHETKLRKNDERLSAFCSKLWRDVKALRPGSSAKVVVIDLLNTLNNTPLDEGADMDMTAGELKVFMEEHPELFESVLALGPSGALRESNASLYAARYENDHVYHGFTTIDPANRVRQISNRCPYHEPGAGKATLEWFIPIHSIPAAKSFLDYIRYHGLSTETVQALAVAVRAAWDQGVAP